MAQEPVSQHLNPITPCENLEVIWIISPGCRKAEYIAKPGYSDKLKTLLERSLTGAEAAARQALRCDVNSPVASDRRAGRHTKDQEKGHLPCQKKVFPRSTRPSPSNAPAAITLRPAPPTRATSSSKSAPPATRSSPASKS